MERNHARLLRVVLVVVAAALLLGACAAGLNDVAEPSAEAGFWQGLWHGLISPVTIIVSLFNEDVGIYEVVNNGGWYDVGFMAGVSTIFWTLGRGGGAAVPARSRRR
ncbi:hypothetical protein V5H98_18330 [Georgenia sp. M64]|uniref:hypothetical protein n=1 Tax=Georgenia sp. M64 TaxID=3120520 RepID=UPI0030DFCCD5